VRVGDLPEQGVAVERGGAVEFYGLDGRPVATLPGFHIYRASAPPSHLVLERDGTYYVLLDYRGVLRPLASRRAADRLTGPDERDVGLPKPRFHGRPAVGHWRFATSSPRYSDLILAQWSGECEVPTAFFVELDEHDVVPVTGEEDLGAAPESLALGWTSIGRAVVFLPHGACGGSGDPPGVYLFRAAGRGTLLVEAPPGSVARMWGITVAD
jgi:hypothetical protein